MTNTKNGTVEGGERPQSPRRRPPTIDLEATEIASDPPPPSAAAGADEEKAAGETHSPAAEAPGATPAPPATPAGPIRVRRWRFLGAFLAGAATAAVLGAAALWSLGALPLTRDHDQEPLLAAKVAGLDRRLQELATPLPAPSREATLEARLAALEAARASPPPVADSTLVRIQALEQRLNETPAPAPADKTPVTADHQEIEALTARIATLEQRLSEAHPAPASDRAVRLGLAAMQLRMAVERGSPFPAELETVSRLIDDPSDLAALKALADTGLPTPSALAQTLSKLTPAMLQAAGPPRREGGVLDRLEAGAERLVRIRRIDEAPGDDPAAVIARADVKATRGDIAGALAEIDKLPDKVRAPASGWISTARARIAALDAARQISTHALQALGPLAP
ncbi:MAG TPA: mitofilin family membrane protein [Xanthobacteraceae bacterium]|nr:mitofilin family membrane protein [Xanthobacteraceae bacterium]